jgi:formylglycine-generating enzyme required for sulfatase activity
MALLDRLVQIKIKLWIVIGVLLGILITMIAAIVIAAWLLGAWDARKAPQITRNQMGMEFVTVAPGTFIMGSDDGRNDEKPVHQVTITKGFLIGRYEVTAGQWKNVMGKEPPNFKSDFLPLQFVSWDNAQEFIGRLNQRNDGYVYRLPTEAEWEYACRAGTTGAYPDNLEWLAFYEANSGHRVHQVGEKHSNAPMT